MFVYSDVNPADQTPDDPSSTEAELFSVTISDKDEVVDLGTIYIDKY